MKMEVNATPQEVMRAVEALREFGRVQRLPDTVVFGLALALEECGCNIVQHSLGRDARQKFRVAVERKRTQILIELRDAGPEFDLTGFTKPSAPAQDEDPIGGWGIPIVRRYTDAIQYRREGNENVLLLIKHLDEPSAGRFKA
jgi:anti-sigma regulatory factor (Ser/Thr protein kinase)